MMHKSYVVKRINAIREARLLLLAALIIESNGFHSNLAVELRRIAKLIQNGEV